MELSKPSESKTAAACQVALLAVLVCWIYSGINHIFYSNLYQYLRGDFSYSHDIYLKNSFFYNSSALWWLVRLTGLPLDRDLVGFAVHVLLSLTALFFAWRIIQRVLPEPNRLDCMSLILLLAVHDSAILDTTRNGLLTWHSSSPTTFAHSLMFALFYLVLRERFWMASLTATVMMLFALKTTWSPLGAAMLFGCFFCRRGTARWLWFLPPLAAAAYLIANSPHSSNPAVRLQLTELALTRDTWESAIDLQPPMRLFALGLSFIAFVFLNRLTKDAMLRKLGWAVLMTTIGIVVVTGAYTAFFYRYFPNPSLVAVGPVRATNVFHFFFFLLAYSWLLQNTALPRRASMLILAALFFISHIWFDEKKQLLLFALLFIGVAAIGLMALLLTGKMRRQDCAELSFFPSLSSRTLAAVAVMILVASTSFYTLATSCPGFNLPSFVSIGRWTVPPIDRQLLGTLVSLRNCKEDFVLMVVGTPRALTPQFISDRSLSVDMTANSIAGKSQYLGDYAHFYFDLFLYGEHVARRKLGTSFLEALNARTPLPPDVLDGLSDRKVAVLLPTALSPSLEHQVPVVRLQSGWSLAIFDRTGECEAILNRHLAVLGALPQPASPGQLSPAP